ncbi:MAG: LysR family transcriptional regulator substrate-binding protein [Eubacteriales bacterium]
MSDVATLRSEIGILYLSDFNRTAINKLLRGAELEFHHLINCGAYVYLSRKHPLAGKSSISREELDDYPCLTFEQGDSGSFYYAEEIISTADFPRVIHACDRATMLNLMVGLNGYTVCSGIICEELNGSDYAAVPFDRSDPEGNKTMEIGYITRKNTQLSDIGTLYVEKIREYLSGTDGKDGKS